MHANFLNLQTTFNSTKKILHFIFFIISMFQFMLTKFVNARIENTKRLPQVSAILQTFICSITLRNGCENRNWIQRGLKWQKSTGKFQVLFEGSVIYSLIETKSLSYFWFVKVAYTNLWFGSHSTISILFPRIKTFSTRFNTVCYL